jgi:hypothetical protein
MKNEMTIGDGIVDIISTSLENSLNESASKMEKPYVVKYMNGSECLGYHASSMCQITDNPLLAKRYQGEGDDVVRQLATISGNLKSILSSEESDSFPGSMFYRVKKLYWEGIAFDDVFLEAEYLPEDITPQTFRVTKI